MKALVEALKLNIATGNTMTRIRIWFSLCLPFDRSELDRQLAPLEDLYQQSAPVKVKATYRLTL